MIIKLKCLRPDLYIEALLERIKLTKQVFMFDIEQENEVYIPHEFNQSSLPLSFIFYDATIALIQENVCHRKRSTMALK